MSYNLDELKNMANNDKDFLNHAINIFIENSESAVTNFRKLLAEEDWKEIGETAHKILPSYRHLEVDNIIPNLVDIKTRTLINKDNKGVGELVKDTIAKIDDLILVLKEETGEKS